MKKGIKYFLLNPFFIASLNKLGTVPNNKNVKTIYVSVL